MKNTYIALLQLIILQLLITNTAYAGAGKIVTTIKPLHSLIAGVAGSDAEVELLLEGNVSPHDFQLKPSQIRLIENADIVFYVDDNFETFLSRAFLGISSDTKKAEISKADNILLLPLRKGGLWKEHEHHHDHEHENHEKKQSATSMDPHLWLFPQNAKYIVKFIAAELGSVYPKNKELYNTNADKLIKRLDALDAELKGKLIPAQEKEYMVFHDAYQYFEHGYGLSAVGSIVLEPHQPPAPSRIRQLREKISEAKIICVFSEPQFSDKIISTIISGSGVKTGILDPLGYNLTAGEDLYFTMLKNIADNVTNCLL